MDRITRKELKGDKFARDVGLTVEYIGEHRAQVIRYSIVAVAVLAVVFGFFYYRRQQRIARQAALTAAIDVEQTPIGPPSSEYKSFPTERERDGAAAKAFSDLVAKYPGSDQATISQYYLGTLAARQDKMLEAEKWLKEAAQSGNANYASLAMLTLADLYKSQGNTKEAEKLYRALIAKPSDFVSPEQATLELAELLAPSNPKEARKLLDPLSKTNRAAIGRQAIEMLGQLPNPR